MSAKPSITEETKQAVQAAKLGQKLSFWRWMCLVVSVFAVSAFAAGAWNAYLQYRSSNLIEPLLQERNQLARDLASCKTGAEQRVKTSTLSR